MKAFFVKSMGSKYSFTFVEFQPSPPPLFPIHERWFGWYWYGILLAWPFLLLPPPKKKVSRWLSFPNRYTLFFPPTSCKQIRGVGIQRLSQAWKYNSCSAVALFSTRNCNCKNIMETKTIFTLIDCRIRLRVIRTEPFTRPLNTYCVTK